MESYTHHLHAFHQEVSRKYQLFNALFITLPFEKLHEVGIELPVFAELCQRMLKQGATPLEIVEHFLKEVVRVNDFAAQGRIMILMLQFIERQIVLFDALEDAAFCKTHDCTGPGTLQVFSHHLHSKQTLTLCRQLLNEHKIRIVLTAHPTQFYPPHVLGIIHDLTKILQKNQIDKIYHLLLQLGKTPFKSRQQPTPLHEADVLIYYIEKTLYPTIKKLQYRINQWLAATTMNLPPLFEVGFWPGGDRDGNPNVDVNTTLAVARKLKAKIIELYLHDLQRIKRRLTFQQVMQQLEAITQKLTNTLYEDLFNKKEKNCYSEAASFLEDLRQVRQHVMEKDQGLFVELLNQLIAAVSCFGFFCASIDIRQTSEVHAQLLQAAFLLDGVDYIKLTETEKMNLLKTYLSKKISPAQLRQIKSNLLYADVIGSLTSIKTIQKQNGLPGVKQYIISHCHHAVNLFEVYLLAHWATWPVNKLHFDIVPLFESVNDLQNANHTLETLFKDPFYRQHLKRRHNRQVVMLGFSDGTKDGGYVTANWEIFKCKLQLTQLAQQYRIKLVFFDGRGGPPSRGGGNTHQYYQSVSRFIKQEEINLTIQGQTISFKYGTKMSASFNLEQLLTVELSRLGKKTLSLANDDYHLMDKLSIYSQEKYLKLKDHPVFLDYLLTKTPLLLHNELLLSSRPVSRQQNFSLEHLRAIPFVGAWTQMKQNVPGFYGLGTALEKLIAEGYSDALSILYKRFLFFKTLIANAEQSLCKANFLLTRYLAQDKIYGEFWQLLFDEAQLTEKMIKQLTKQEKLLDDEPVLQASIAMRENIVLPLLILQQYALQKLSQTNNKEEINFFHNLILKAMPATVNASRNSV